MNSALSSGGGLGGAVANGCTLRSLAIRSALTALVVATLGCSHQDTKSGASAEKPILDRWQPFVSIGPRELRLDTTTVESIGDSVVVVWVKASFDTPVSWDIQNQMIGSAANVDTLLHVYSSVTRFSVNCLRRTLTQLTGEMRDRQGRHAYTTQPRPEESAPPESDSERFVLGACRTARAARGK
jgi:hypothetical protein